MEEYAPVNQLKEFGPRLWVVDSEMFYRRLPPLKFPFLTRAAVVQLEGGGLLVISPTKLTDDLAASVDKLGPVQHLASPNLEHYLYLNAWKDRYPQATVWAPKGTKEQMSQHPGLRDCIDKEFGDSNPGWPQEVELIPFDYGIVRGQRFLEMVFHHPRSRTVYIGDGFLNYERSRVKGILGPLIFHVANIGGKGDGQLFGGTPAFLPKAVKKGGLMESVRVSVQRVLGTHPDNVVVSHGRNVQGGAVEVLNKVF